MTQRGPPWRRKTGAVRHGAGLASDGGASPARIVKAKLVRTNVKPSSIPSANSGAGRSFIDGLFIAPHNRTKARDQVRLNCWHPLALPFAAAVLLVSPILLCWAAIIKVRDTFFRTKR